MLQKEMEVFSHGKPNLVPYEIIIRATSGGSEAVDEVLQHYSRKSGLSLLKTGIKTP